MKRKALSVRASLKIQLAFKDAQRVLLVVMVAVVITLSVRIILQFAC